MGIQIIGTKKCRETQKTERYFKERGWPYHFVDLNQRSLSSGELAAIVTAIGAEELIDTESKVYKRKGMAYMEFDPVEEIEENPALMKTPVVRDGRKAVLGYNPDEWKEVHGLSK
ncbi:MAG: glutaredoxin [Spirochaetales bacterium]|uniref:Glutaredoxin n=1 Tax=Candidatus Thalassospirochaeta sargassi TaxID=3119039 RepID=A0AAJ1MJG8_9SPIO|nr:glutaredoxin [Spirochaetales bacterium]